ncbi:MAG: sigma-70 family RNA polymerase sigma factor [Acidimicrobiales bacterium]|nr:sigma-70 family RNA polymerase sigma factor [Actinomycetota bacterium]
MTAAPDPDEPRTVAAAQAGDRAALEALLRRHQPQIHAVCRRITGNDADALDATQEALIAIVRGLSRFDGRSRFSTWAYRVATNACLDELRRRRRRPAVGLGDRDAAEVDRPAPDPGPDERAADRLDVDAALARLPEEFRVAVVLRDLCQLDYAEIAEVLEIPAGTVRSRIARGRAQLADHLAGNQTGPTERPTIAP